MRSELKKRVRKEVDDFCAGEKAVESFTLGISISRRDLGLVAAAAVIAAELGIVAPWTVKHARRSVLRIYRRARKAIDSKSGSAEALLANLREACREGKFPIVEKGKSVPKSARSLAVGIRRTRPNHGMVLAIPRARLEEVVQPRILAKAVMKDLVRKGTIVKASDGKLTHQIDVKGLGGSAETLRLLSDGRAGGGRRNHKVSREDRRDGNLSAASYRTNPMIPSNFVSRPDVNGSD